MNLRDTAVAAARDAAEIQTRHFRSTLRVDRQGPHDVKLEVDRLCEQAIVDTIRRRWPDHAIVTEEGGRAEGAGDHTWFVDPLDGTVNYFYGLPYYCVSVACYRTSGGEAEGEYPRSPASPGEPLVGVVCAPPTGELFVAEAGRGAECNGSRIQASGVSDLAEAMAAMGFGSRPDSVARFADRVARVGPHLRKVRCLGAAAYDLCQVAAGRLSAFAERGLHSWDIAAAQVVLREAGAVLDSAEVEAECWDVVASAPGIHPRFRDLVRGV